MKTAKFSLLPLSICLLFPLCAEPMNENTDSIYKDQQQGNDSHYDRYIRPQNHPAAQPQIQGERSAPTEQKAPIAQATSQMNSDSGQMAAPQVMNTNFPARPPLKNALNLWVQGEALLWQAHEENLTYAYRTDATESFTDLKTIDFKWDWGFRVALGYNAPRDGWDFSLMWTHIKNHSGNSQHATDDALVLPAWQINDISLNGILLNGSASRAKAHWNVNLDQVDFALGKEYYVGKYLTLRPNGGLRADWIFQKYDLTYVPLFAPSMPQKIKMDNRYFGFGFFGGLDTDWMLGRGFSIYGMADFAILVGFFDVDQKVTQTNPSTGILQKGSMDNSFRCGRGILDTSLGLKWCHLFSKKSWGLTFKAGYEYHVYFDQNQFLLIANSQPKFFKPDGDLTYQGVALSGQIDF